MSILIRGTAGGSLLLDGERIAALGDVERPGAARSFDASGLFAAPGLIELQINGAVGHDLTADPASIWEVGAALPRWGVTAFLPTIVSSPAAVLDAARGALRAGPPPGYRGALPLGLHLEGPFISRAGAHRPEHLRRPEATVDWRPENGVRMVTLAPELPGALDLIAQLAAHGVLVAAGHSEASASEAAAGIEGGVRYATHLFNAMPPLDHRAPGLVGALLADRRVALGLIVDGLHVDPLLTDLVWRLGGPGRVSLVTDAMAALGCGHGTFALGDAQVTVDGSGARLADGRLAGSLISLDTAVRNLVGFTGCAPADALETVTATPARLLRLADRGRLQPGARADVVLLTPELEVVATFVGGAPAHVAEAGRWD
jgi:N-acetylglucosamine-6-phosphate deacetylase